MMQWKISWQALRPTYLLLSSVPQHSLDGTRKVPLSAAGNKC